MVNTEIRLIIFFAPKNGEALYYPKLSIYSLQCPSKFQGMVHKMEKKNSTTCIKLLLFSCQVSSVSLWLHRLQHGRLPCSLPPPRICPSSCPLNWWCQPTISSSVTLLSFCLQSFPASGSFPMSQLITLGGQSIGDSASASVILKSKWGWFPLRLTGWSPCCPSLKTSVLQHSAFFTVCPALTCVHDYRKELSLNYTDLCQQSDVFAFNTLSRFVIAFLPRSNHRLISWLQ